MPASSSPTTGSNGNPRSSSPGSLLSLPPFPPPSPTPCSLRLFLDPHLLPKTGCVSQLVPRPPSFPPTPLPSTHTLWLRQGRRDCRLPPFCSPRFDPLDCPLPRLWTAPRYGGTRPRERDCRGGGGRDTRDWGNGDSRGYGTLWGCGVREVGGWTQDFTERTLWAAERGPSNFFFFFTPTFLSLENFGLSERLRGRGLWERLGLSDDVCMSAMVSL